MPSICCRDRFFGLSVDIRNKPVSSLPTQRDAVKQFRGESVKILCRDAISMADIAENQPDSTSGFDPRIQTENITFKPDEMLAKIAEGKMGAFFKEQTLTAQAFVKDGGKTVADYLKESGDVKVIEFKRVALG